MGKAAIRARLTAPKPVAHTLQTMRVPTLAALAATDIALGFGIQALVLLWVGVGAQTDAYYAGQAPALVLLSVFQLPLQRAVVAAFGDARVDSYPAIKLVLVVVVLMSVLIGLISLGGAHVLRIVYPGFSPDALATALQVLRIQGLAVALTAGNLVLLSLNQVGGRFVQCEAALVASAICAALWVVLAIDDFGVLAAAYGQVLKALMSGALYLYLLRGKLTWQRPPWRQVWDVVRPLSSAGLLSKMAPLVDRSIASAAASGSLTVLVFAQTVYGASVGVAERAIVAPRLPALKRDLSVSISFRVAAQLALAGAVLVATLALGVAIARHVDLIVEAVSAPMMKLLLECVVLLAGFPIGTLSAQWMAATMVFVGESRLTARIMIWCFLIGLPVKIVGFQLGGIQGLAASMSCYYLASAVSLCLVLRRLRHSRSGI